MEQSDGFAAIVFGGNNSAVGAFWCAAHDTARGISIKIHNRFRLVVVGR